LRTVGLVALLTLTVALTLEPAAASTPRTGPARAAAASAGCAQRPPPRPAQRLPVAVRQWADTTGLVGGGDLWARPLDKFPLVYTPSPADPSTGTWGTKFPWFRLTAGSVHVTGRRLDGPGAFTADLAPVASYAAPGFLPSNLSFSTGGCWRVTGRLGRSKVVLFKRVDGSPSAVCASLAREAVDIREINSPANDALALLVDQATRAHGCPASS
jgi:hypothetical protein